jgi:hypothetical protein
MSKHSVIFSTPGFAPKIELPSADLDKKIATQQLLIQKQKEAIQRETDKLHSLESEMNELHVQKKQFLAMTPMERMLLTEVHTLRQKMDQGSDEKKANDKDHVDVSAEILSDTFEDKKKEELLKSLKYNVSEAIKYFEGFNKKQLNHDNCCQSNISKQYTQFHKSTWELINKYNKSDIILYIDYSNRGGVIYYPNTIITNKQIFGIRNGGTGPVNKICPTCNHPSSNFIELLPTKIYTIYTFSQSLLCEEIGIIQSYMNKWYSEDHTGSHPHMTKPYSRKRITLDKKLSLLVTGSFSDNILGEFGKNMKKYQNLIEYEENE